MHKVRPLVANNHSSAAVSDGDEVRDEKYFHAQAGTIKVTSKYFDKRATTSSGAVVDTAVLQSTQSSFKVKIDDETFNTPREACDKLYELEVLSSKEKIYQYQEQIITILTQFCEQDKFLEVSEMCNHISLVLPMHCCKDFVEFAKGVMVYWIANTMRAVSQELEGLQVYRAKQMLKCFNGGVGNVLLSNSEVCGAVAADIDSVIRSMSATIRTQVFQPLA